MTERGPANPVTMVTSLPFALFLCVILGLAPLYPEPHLVGKVRWVAGGAVGMGPVDWFDLVWHSWPFVWLLVVIGMRLRKPPADHQPG